MALPPALQVLVIDDDADTRANLHDILELDEYQVETAGTIAEALSRTDWDRFSTIILDRKLPDGNAEELLPRLRQLAPQAAVMIVTGFADLEGAIAAIRQGAADYLLKPINADLLRSRLAGVAERKRAAEEIGRLNQALQHRVTELETLLDVVPVGIAIALDAECRRIRVNPYFARLLGIAPGANASVSAPDHERPPYRCCRNGKQLPDEELPMQYAAARGVEVRDAEVDVVQPDGRVLTILGYAAPLFDEHGQPRGSVGAFVDITERKRALEQTLQTERLAAIGQMMTGLAHESGNALARSQSCLEMLTWEVEDRPEALDLIKRIQRAQDHLGQLYDEVRSYAAPLKLEREEWDLAGIWRQAWENLALARQGRVASLREETDGANLRCSVDQFRLEQVFRNILDNALAACVDPVQITVSAAQTSLSGRPAVRVTVRDKGPGLSPEQRQRIFDPFFTTKTKGTGLGMAIAKRIVEAHGGQITVGPGSDRGAEIVIVLPRDST
jgi:signal transduction histidine kinase/FixJ family two-component response regulator